MEDSTPKIDPALQKKIDSINWKDFGEVRQTCYCRCGEIYRSHNKMVPYGESKLTTVSKDPCPSCGKWLGNCRRVSSDTERITL